MKTVNAQVRECGQPRKAYYMATHVDGTKHYMEIRYGQRQSRKWVPKANVTIHDGVELIYVEKVTELAPKGRKVS